jgi:hypothetical protein
MARTCAACSRSLPRTSYTANQYSKGGGVSRCASCVHGHSRDTPSAKQSNSGRYNGSKAASFSRDALDHPFAQGGFRWVAKGTYDEGLRSGQACVTKWFKTGTVFSDDYFTLDIKAVNKALEIVNLFNQLGIVKQVIKINVAEVWTCTADSPGDLVGSRNLLEPFIENYEKFNSNSGWSDESVGWAEVMQALSHFSYHAPAGIMFYAISKAASIGTLSFFPTR